MIRVKLRGLAIEGYICFGQIYTIDRCGLTNYWLTYIGAKVSGILYKHLVIILQNMLTQFPFTCEVLNGL